MDELPVVRREELLLVGSAVGEVDDLRERPDLLARPRPEKIEPDLKGLERARLLRPGAGGLERAQDSQRGPGSVQVRGCRGEEPVLEIEQLPLLLLGLLQLGEPRDVGVGGELGGEGTTGAQEEHRHLLEPVATRRRHHSRPPILAAKILPRQAQLLKVILQQQPGPLGIRAPGEQPQDLLPLRHPRLGVRELPTELRQRPIRLGKNVMMGVVLGRAAS